MQSKGVLVPYTTSKGHKIAILRHGLLTVPEMFNAEHSDVRMTTWKLRGCGIFILYASSVCLARLLRIFRTTLPNPYLYKKQIFFKISVGRSPLLRKLIPSDVTSSANLAIAFSVSLFVISTAWMFYRPMLGAGLLMASVSPFLYHTMGFYNIAPNQNGYYNR